MCEEKGRERYLRYIAITNFSRFLTKYRLEAREIFLITHFLVI